MNMSDDEWSQFTDFANLANGSSSINFKINDISIVYREKRVK